MGSPCIRSRKASAARSESLLSGLAAKRFHNSAMGKFLNTVPTQIRGSSATGRPASTTLKSTLANRLMDGHITSVVHPMTTQLRKKELSRSGSSGTPSQQKTRGPVLGPRVSHFLPSPLRAYGHADGGYTRETV